MRVGLVSSSVALLAALLVATLPLLLPNDLLFLNCRRVVEFLRSSGTRVISSFGCARIALEDEKFLFDFGLSIEPYDS